VPVWFIAAFVPMVASQIVRLHQHDAAWWLVCDYAGRIGALAVIAAFPGARAIAFARVPLRVGWRETAALAVGLIVVTVLLLEKFEPIVAHHIANHQIGTIPNPTGAWRVLDMTIGLALATFHEEVVFRRCARAVFGRSLGDGWKMIVASALLFATYHWWTGITNIAVVAIFGVAAMLIYRRIGALWPLVLAHYLIDLVVFYLWP
jgi:membrane protease YdiL (CAAX protease family)